MSESGSAARYRANLQGEIGGAALYRALAESEPDPRLSEVYGRLAAVEEAHAEFWRRELAKVGAKAGVLRPDWRSRALAWLARRFGPQFVLPVVSALERRDSGHYDAQPEAVAGGLPDAERSHQRVVQTIEQSIPGGLSGGALARLEGRHRSGGNALRAAVLGANDGLVSNLSLVMGVAGAATSGRTILLTGIAGLVAGACSMAMGEWLSVNSSREMHQRQIDEAQRALKASPQLDRDELAVIYQSKGLDAATAAALADKLFQSQDAVLDTLAREELGVDPQELGGSAWAAGGTSFMLFAIGAIFPVAPYFGLAGTAALTASLAASGAALFLIGAGTSLFTGRRIWFSGVRQLVVGLGAAGVTFGIGRLIGVAVAG